METKEKITYKVQIAYRVWDYVEVTLDADQNSNDAKEIAEGISFERSMNDMEIDHDYTEIIQTHKPRPDQVFERCPHCETESGYTPDRMIQDCPTCGKTIVLCAMCEEVNGCKECLLVRYARTANKQKARCNNETENL